MEIEAQIFVDAGITRTLYFSLSDNSVYASNTLDNMHEQEVAMMDETDEHVVQNKWVVTGLTPGNTYKYYFACKASHASTYDIRWGGTGGLGFSTFIMKATALPDNILIIN